MAMGSLRNETVLMDDEAESPVRLLVVDDRAENLLALGAILEAPDRELVLVRSGREALRELLRRQFALVLLDVNMPVMDGFETAQLIRQRPSSSHTPIIFITAQHDELLATRSYALGAVDYITTPVNPEVLRAKAAVFVELFRKTEENSRQAELLRRAEERLRVQAEARLREADERLRLVVESLVDYAIFSLDPEGRIASWNAGAERLFGYSGDEALGCLGESLFAPDHQGGGPEGRWQDALHGDRVEVEAWFERKGGTRFFGRGVRMAMRSPDGELHGYSTVVHDATERKRSEEELARQAEQLREANRLKDEFLAVLSHELRTPLNAIIGWTHMLRMEKLEPDVAKRALEAIARNGEAQLALINDILDVSRFVAGKLRIVLARLDVRDAARAAADTAMMAARAKGVELRVELGAEPLLVNGDADRLQQAVWNLVSNAVKFTPAGGHVRLTAEKRGNLVVVCVADDGIGIPAWFLPHVFERFRQADSSSIRSHGGLGLGLAIVRHLVEMHGGTVTVASDGEGRGCSFEIVLPAYDVPGGRSKVVERAAPAAAGPAPIGAPPSAEAPLSAGPVSGTRCLVVDDDPDTRDILKRVLEHEGAIVTMAGSVTEALQRIDRAHLLLADIAMPGEDGYSLIRQVRRLPQDQGGAIPSIALTAYASDDDRQLALHAGFDRHLPKPIQHDRLLEVIAELLKERAAPPQGAGAVQAERGQAARG